MDSNNWKITLPREPQRYIKKNKKQIKQKGKKLANLVI